MDNIKEWTGMDFASSIRAAEDRTRWSGVGVKSTVVPLRHRKVMGWTRQKIFITASKHCRCKGRAFGSGTTC